VETGALQSDTISVRTLFLSDIHLGTTGCQTAFLLEFLKRYEADTVYLVGDIIDGWRLRKGWYWPQGHNDVVQKLLRKVRKGAKLIYIPGNHDEFLREYAGGTFGGIEIHEHFVHHGADGARYLVIHGDVFDVVVVHARWLAYLGDWAYEAALKFGQAVSFVRRRMGLPYWSLSAWAKHRVKTAVNFIGSFENCLAEEARRTGANGVICGHIHHAAERQIGDIRYLNTGDWVESCTALVEHADGRMEIIYFADILREEQTVPVQKALSPPLALVR
jgi:UDP-2,3-diacylglucosamine pyrophosphatase LpxH